MTTKDKKVLLLLISILCISVGIAWPSATLSLIGGFGTGWLITDLFT